jgi:hypothetical protein
MEMDYDAPELDWAIGKELTGCSDLQVRYVQGICQGLNRSAAAKRAGYVGTDNAIRSQASRAHKSSKVQALLGWARTGGAGPSDAIGDVTELKKILWKHARGQDKNHAIKAATVLHSLAERERQIVDGNEWDGLSDWRWARDSILDGPDWTAAFVLWYGRRELAALPMLHDLVPVMKHHWPEIWDKRLARQNANARASLERQLADRDWQRETREQVWAEKGYTLNREGGVTLNPDGARVKIDTDTGAMPPAEVEADTVA